MKAHVFVGLIIGCLSVTAIAVEWAFEYRPAEAKYTFYSGTLDDAAAPDKKNVKIAFEVTGKAAKEMFDAMGPDKKDACSSEDQTRFRSRDGDKISCLLSNKGEFSCSFGFDLRSGKSIGGSIC